MNSFRIEARVQKDNAIHSSDSLADERELSHRMAALLLDRAVYCNN